jgi:hypothetical protein
LALAKADGYQFYEEMLASAEMEIRDFGCAALAAPRICSLGQLVENVTADDRCRSPHPQSQQIPPLRRE